MNDSDKKKQDDERKKREEEQRKRDQQALDAANTATMALSVVMACCTT